MLARVISSLSLLSAAASAFQLPSSAFGIPGVDVTFDYVVVGGGTAGLAIASRLAEDSRLSVAVVEAGGFYEVDNGNFSVIPGFASMFTGTDPEVKQPLIDWGFVTTPQAGADNRRMHYTRGKTLGGSSARNFMLYHRPTVGSMQRWADDVGDQSWTFPNTLPFFEKSAQYSPPDQALFKNATNNQTSTGFLPSGGPLRVSYSGFIDAFSTWAQRAFQNVGLKAIDGFNTGKLIGSAWLTFSVNPRNAHRDSSETSFLQSAIAKSSTLQVYTRTEAQRILFDQNRVATGVQVSTQGTYGTPGVNFTLSAKREVIISAGAFQSPQLLMVSGIGPASTLKRLNIPVVKDAPGVGQDMWDHWLWPVQYRVALQTQSALMYSPTFLAESSQAYDKNASGILSTFGSSYFAFEKLPTDLRRSFSNATNVALSKFPSDWPELELGPLNGYLGLGRGPRDLLVDGTNLAGIVAIMVAPLSRGNVTIASNRMADPPVITPNWLTHPADIEQALAAFKRQRQVGAELRRQGIIVGDEVLPGPNVTTDAQILSYIRSAIGPLWHPSTTCKMGKANDSMAVVDAQARVYGVQGLRVVDASIFPILPPGHPQATVYMVAEKIAADIMGKKDENR